MNRVVIATIAPVLAVLSAAQAPTVPALAPEQQLLKLVNLERESAGLEKLQWDAKIADAARAHAQRLANHGGLSHQFAGEPELDQRVGATGARFNAVAENVALAETVEEAHLALMNSPGHRANIMESKYNVVGIGVVQVEKVLYVTEDFARSVPVYSGKQFREGVVEAFNGLRQAKGIQPIDSRPDPQLERAACSGKTDPGAVLESLSGATRAIIFTANHPNDLPPRMEEAAADVTLRSMRIGVCFRPEGDNGFARFWVVAAFYPAK